MTAGHRNQTNKRASGAQSICCQFSFKDWPSWGSDIEWAMGESSQMGGRVPSATDALFNRVFGFLVGLGIGPSYAYLLQVPGGKGPNFSPARQSAGRGRPRMSGRAAWPNAMGARRGIHRRGHAEKGECAPEIPRLAGPRCRKGENNEGVSG